MSKYDQQQLKLIILTCGSNLAQYAYAMHQVLDVRYKELGDPAVSDLPHGRHRDHLEATIASLLLGSVV